MCSRVYKSLYIYLNVYFLMPLTLDNKKYNGIWIGERDIVSARELGSSGTVYLKVDHKLRDKYGIIKGTRVEIVIVGIIGGDNDEENID